MATPIGKVYVATAPVKLAGKEMVIGPFMKELLPPVVMAEVEVTVRIFIASVATIPLVSVNVPLTETGAIRVMPPEVLLTIRLVKAIAPLPEIVCVVPLFPPIVVVPEDVKVPLLLKLPFKFNAFELAEKAALLLMVNKSFTVIAPPVVAVLVVFEMVRAE